MRENSSDRGRESARQKLTELEREVVAALEAGGYEEEVNEPSSFKTSIDDFLTVRGFDTSHWPLPSKSNLVRQWQFYNLTEWQIKTFKLEKIKSLLSGYEQKPGPYCIEERFNVFAPILQDDVILPHYWIRVRMWRGDSLLWRIVGHNLPEEHSEDISSQRFRR